MIAIRMKMAVNLFCEGKMKKDLKFKTAAGLFVAKLTGKRIEEWLINLPGELYLYGHQHRAGYIYPISLLEAST